MAEDNPTPLEIVRKGLAEARAKPRRVLMHPDDVAAIWSEEQIAEMVADGRLVFHGKEGQDG